MGFFDIEADDSMKSMFDRNDDGVLDRREQMEYWDYIEGSEEIGGMDIDDFHSLDDDAKREILEHAGLDPDDYDL